jgi:phage FluMu protein Com
MADDARDIRCTACGKLLARMCDGVLTIQRGELQVTIDGEFRASFVCSQPRCRRLNLISVRSHGARLTAFP